jgi:hypothetical protein
MPLIQEAILLCGTTNAKQVMGYSAEEIIGNPQEMERCVISAQREKAY